MWLAGEMARARTILITGCSSGIGLDAARTLHASGEWRVFACCRKEEDVDAMRARHGIESFLIDYSKPETIERGFEDVMRETGGTLDALFNNCLLYTSPSPRDQRGSRMPSSA